MAVGLAENIIRVRGRVCIDPTDLAAAFPHGGTAIGNTRAAALAYNVQSRAITAEEWGGRTARVLYAVQSAVLSLVLRDYDADALATFFPQVSGSLVTDDTDLQGFYATPHVIVVSPIALDFHPWIILYAGVPLPEDSARMQMSMAQEPGIAVVLRAIPDAQGRVYAKGLRTEVTL